MDIPITGIAFGGIGGTAKTRCLACLGRLHRRLRPIVALIGPEFGPRAAFQSTEVVNLHDALAAVAHELKATFQVENLDAIAATGEHAAQDVGVTDEIRACGPELAVHG